MLSSICFSGKEGSAACVVVMSAMISRSLKVIGLYVVLLRILIHSTYPALKVAMESDKIPSFGACLQLDQWMND